MTTTNTNTTTAMSFDRRTNSKTYKHNWVNGRCNLSITYESWITVKDEAMNGGRVQLHFFLSNKCQLFSHVGEPPATVVVGRDVSVLRTWNEDTHVLVSPETTEAWRGMSSLLEGLQRLPTGARDFLKSTICAEARDAAQKAIFLDHRKMWVGVKVEVVTEEMYDPREEREVMEEDMEDEEDEDEDEEEEEEEEEKGLSMATIERNLKVENFIGDVGSLEECTICLIDLKETVIGRMPCDHIFHRPCITKWLEKKNGCPICRFKLQ